MKLLLIAALLAVFAASAVHSATTPPKSPFPVDIPPPKRHMAPVNNPPLNISAKQEEELRPKIDSPPTGKDKPPSDAGKSTGAIKSQIVNGVVAARGMFPWQILFIADGAIMCGGSIISNLWILTAGHCTYGRTSFQIGLGFFDRSSTTETGRIITTTTLKAVHASYNPNYVYYDIAALKLTAPVAFSSYIGPVRLPRASQATTTFAGLAAIVSGWGYITNTGPTAIKLNYANMVVQTNAYCASLYGSSYVTSAHICASGSPSTATNACSGDSGGPLINRQSDGLFTLIGVVSYGSSNGCTAGYPSVYTRVTSYLGWISSTTGIAILP